MTDISKRTLKELQECFQQHVDEVGDNEYEESDYELFQPIVKRLVELVPVLKPYFDAIHEDNDAYAQQWYVDNDMVDCYAVKVQAVFDHIDYTTNQVQLSPKLKQILNVPDQDDEECTVEQPLSPKAPLSLNEPLSPKAPLSPNAPTPEPTVESIPNRKRKAEIFEEDDIVVVKVIKSKRIIIDLLDD